ncbi:hypothetical protein OV450_3721 [Actinobacteria bacterium OV450]|nr:hypothetical protein OV450_3721 [Actinobacteria bacterium OV450]
MKPEPTPELRGRVQPGGKDTYVVKLYRDVYDSVSTIYPKGSDRVTVPTRTANAMLESEGDHEREMGERKPGWGA